MFLSGQGNLCPWITLCGKQANALNTWSGTVKFVVSEGWVALRYTSADSIPATGASGNQPNMKGHIHETGKTSVPAPALPAGAPQTKRKRMTKLSDIQIRVLKQLDATDPKTPGQIAREMGTSSRTVQNAMAVLVNRYFAKVHSPANARRGAQYVKVKDYRQKPQAERSGVRVHHVPISDVSFADSPPTVPVSLPKETWW